MTELKAAKVAAIAQKLERNAFEFRKEIESGPIWLDLPYSFPDKPTLEKVTAELYKAVDWHTQCDVRCAYGTYPMIVDTCIWISMADLTTNQIHGLCVLLNRLYHEALGKWG